MTFDHRFVDLMPSTITVNAFSKFSTNGYGMPTYATAATKYRARIVTAKRMMFEREGQQIVPTHVAWLATTAAIDGRSKFTFGGTTYRLLDVQLQYGLYGPHHTKVLLKGG